MPGSYVVDGTEYRFPDNYTDEQVQGILSAQGIIKNAPKDLAPPPSLEKPVLEAPHQTFAPKSYQIGTSDLSAPPPVAPGPMMVNGPVMRRVPGTSVYRGGDRSLNVAGSKPIGEKVAGGGPTFSGPPTPEEMPIGKLANQIADTPLIAPDTFDGKNDDNALGYAVDAGQGVLNAAAGSTTPKNIAIMLATMGLAAVPGILAKLGSAGVSAYFATQAGKAAMEQYPELKHHAEQGAWHAVAANAGAIAANVGMAVGAGTHALGEATGAASESLAPKEPTAEATPTPPTQVQRVSPATPNPPTAATATTPESPATIALQVDQLGQGARKVVMFPKGQGQPGVLPEGVSVTHDAFGNTYAYRPDLVKTSEIHSAAKNNTLPEILGGPEGMGAPDKSALQGEPITVVGRSADGTEAQSTATDPEHLPETVAATHAVTPPGGTVGVEPVEGVLGERAGVPTVDRPPEPATENNTQVSENTQGSAVPDASTQPPPAGDFTSTFEGADAPREAVLKNAAEQIDNFKPGDKILNVVSDDVLNDIPGWIEAQAPDDFSSTGAKLPEGDLFRVDPVTGEFSAVPNADQDGIYFKRAKTPGEQPAAQLADNPERGSIPASALAIPGMDAALDQSIAMGRDVRNLFAPQTIDAGAKTTAGRLRAMFGKRLLLEARAKAAFEGFRNEFYKQASELGVHALNVIDAIEDKTGQKLNALSPEDRAYADSIRKEYDDRWNKLKKLGRLNEYLQNYYTHLYADDSAAERFVQSWQGRKPIAGAENFRKQRVYPTFREAITPEAQGGGGLKPKFDNPVDYLFAGLSQMDKAITGHEFFQEQKPDGVYSQGAGPEGYSPVDDKIFKVFGPKHGAVVLPDDAINAGMTPEEVRVLGRREMGKWYFPDGQAQVLNNYLKPGIESGKNIFDTWMKAKGIMNGLNLGFSAFHGATTSLNSAFSDMGLGLQQLGTKGQRVEGVKSIGRGITPLASVITDTLRGKDLVEAYNGTAKNPDPSALATVEALKQAGGSPHQATYNQHYFQQSLQKAFAEGRFGSAAMQAVNPLLYAEMVDRIAPIMTKLVPRAKIAAFEKAWNLEQLRNPNMPLDEVRSRAAKIWDSMDNRFGQLNQRNMLMNNMAKDVMNAVVGRPGWTIGTAREVLGGGMDAVKNVRDIALGRTTELSPRTAYTLSLVVGGALINGITTAMLTGTAPQGKDFLAPRDGGVTEDGRPSRIVLPMYLSKDIYSWATKPVATLMAKLSPPLTVGADLIRNKNFQDQKIRGAGGMGVGHYLFNSVVPYSAQGVMKNWEREQPLSKTVLPMIGVMPASKSVSLSPSEKVISEYLDDHREATKASPTEHSQLRTKVFLAAKQGNLAKARSLGRDGVAKGLLSPNDVKHSIERAMTNPLVADVKRIPDIKVVLQAYDAATPEERTKIGAEVRKKIVGARAKPYEWDDAAKATAAKYFHLQPIAPRADLSAPGGGF